MKRVISAVAITLVFGSVSFAQNRHRGHFRMSDRHISVNTNAEAPGDGCNDHFKVNIDDREVVTEEEARTLAPAQFSNGLYVGAPLNGGALIRGWDKAEVLIKVCKAASAADVDEARRTLAGIKLRNDGTRYTIEGPDNDTTRWVGYFLINVPRDIKLALDAHNGPLDLRNVAGSITAETVNGPINIHHCSGDIVANAQNGPVTLDAASGKVRVRVQNGPVDVQLAGTTWMGQGLDASAQNGPISLRIPANYQSGVEVTARGSGPFHCETDACAGATKDWDDNYRTVRLGKANETIVHMSTVNGPVSIMSTVQ